MIAITIENERLSAALTELARASQFGLGPIIKEEGRYLTQLFIKFTPPKSKKQGVNAVRKDIGKMTAVLDYNTLKAKAAPGSIYESMARMVRRRETEKLNNLLRNPKISYWGGRRVLSDITQVAEVHLRARNKYGRIPKDQNVAAYKTDARRYRKAIEDRVGWTVAGWIPAAKATGARYKKFAEPLASNAGEVAYWFGRANERPVFIVARNRNVKIPNYQRMIDGAFNSRVSTTTKKVKRLLAGKAVNLGFTRVEGAQPVPELGAQTMPQLLAA
jgi:hypothetical protein